MSPIRNVGYRVGIKNTFDKNLNMLADIFGKWSEGESDLLYFLWFEIQVTLFRKFRIVRPRNIHDAQRIVIEIIEEH